MATNDFLDVSYDSMCELIPVDCSFQCTDGDVDFHQAIVARQSKYVYNKLLAKCPHVIEIATTVKDMMAALNVLYRAVPTVTHKDAVAHRALKLLGVKSELLIAIPYINKTNDVVEYANMLGQWIADDVSPELIEAQVDTYHPDLDDATVCNLSAEGFKNVIAAHKPDDKLTMYEKFTTLSAARYYHDMATGHDVEATRLVLGEYGTHYKPLTTTSFRCMVGYYLLNAINRYVRMQALSDGTGLELFYPELTKNPIGVMWYFNYGSHYNSDFKVLKFTDEEIEKVKSHGKIQPRLY